MPGRGLGNGVVVMRIREPRPAASEPREPAGELRSMLVEMTGAQAVDGYQHDERRRGAARLRSRSSCNHEAAKDQKRFQHGSNVTTRTTSGNLWRKRRRQPIIMESPFGSAGGIANEHH